MTLVERELEKEKYLRTRDSNREVKKFLKIKLVEDEETKDLLPEVQKSKIWT